MASAVIAFSLTNILLVRLPVLPDQLPDTWMLAALVPPASLALLYPRLRMLAMVGLSGWWTLTALQHQLNLRAVVGQHGLGDYEHNIPRDVSLSGWIEDLPIEIDGIARFHLQVPNPRGDPVTLRVSWYHPPTAVKAGQHCQLHLRLRSPRGSVNPGIFDYERWLFVKRIHGLASVRASPANRCSSDGQAGVLKLSARRSELRDRVLRVVPPGEAGTFLALALGDTSQLTRRHWETLNGTGTTHLLIVSGLHVGMIAGLVYGLMSIAGMGLRLTALMTLIASGAYALMAGWGLPVQRAFLMLCVVLVIRLLRRQSPWLLQWLAALLLVLVFDPLATLSSGFWLSFGAVLVLLAGMQDLRVIRFLWLDALVRPQWLVFAGLLPVLAVTMGNLPMASLVTNLVAIPWVGLLIVPLLLLGVLLMLLSESAASLVLSIDGFMVHGLWHLLSVARSLPLVVPVMAPSVPSIILALTGSAILILPVGARSRWIGPLLIAALFWRQPLTESPAMRVRFLDVGQGLAVLIETATQRLLYDTGPEFGARFSAAEQIVLPSLRNTGATRLEVLVISHGDNDHAGGRQTLRQRISVLNEFDELTCDRQWQRDGYTWTLFMAASNNRSAERRNNRSCLLHVSGPGFKLLLTGDIEADAEYQLVARGLQRVNLMSVPHHGSLSSSTPALLNALLPDLAVVSAGHGNRFNHPADDVLRRYRARGARVLSTAAAGAIQVEVRENRMTVSQARETMPAIWRSSHAYP